MTRPRNHYMKHWMNNANIGPTRMPCYVRQLLCGGRSVSSGLHQNREADKTDRLIDTSLPLESRWDSLAQLQHVFGNFGDVIDSHANADLITTTLRDLGKL